MTLTLIKILLASGILATIYRLYRAIVEGHQDGVLNKLSDEVKKDKQKVAEDAKSVQDTTNDYNSAVDKFNRDDK